MIYKKINKASLYVIEICVSHYATELEWIWFLWIGIWNLNYVKQEAPFQAFSYKFCEFSHNYSFWDFMLIKSALLNVIKNHKFDSFKTHKSFFCNRVAFYFIYYCTAKVSASLCIQSECGKIRTLFTQCCAIRDTN